MSGKINQSLIGGIVGTIAITLVTLIAPMMGMPKMNIPAMLSGMLGTSLAIGWVMHFVIGIIFAFIYVYFVSALLRKVSSNILKGVIFGIIAFITGQIALKVMTAMLGGISTPSDKPFLMIMGSIIGHVAFGIAVVFTINTFIGTSKQLVHE